MVWILGDFGEHIDDAPYIFESLVNGIKEGKSNEIDNTKVKHTVIYHFKIFILNTNLFYCSDKCLFEKAVDIWGQIIFKKSSRNAIVSRKFISFNTLK